VVGPAGSPTCTVYVDLTLTRSKVKVTDHLTPVHVTLVRYVGVSSPQVFTILVHTQNGRTKELKGFLKILTKLAHIVRQGDRRVTATTTTG